MWHVEHVVQIPQTATLHPIKHAIGAIPTHHTLLPQLAFYHGWASVLPATCGAMVALLYCPSFSPLQSFRIPGGVIFSVSVCDCVLHSPRHYLISLDHVIKGTSKVGKGYPSSLPLSELRTRSARFLRKHGHTPCTSNCLSLIAPPFPKSFLDTPRGYVPA